MRFYKQLCIAAFSLLFAQASNAQQSVTIEDFAFLQGYWTGTGFGGQSEEIWMPPVDGRMFGIFKQSQDGQLVFTEYMEIVEAEQGFVVRLKHFNPDFSGWETKDEHVTFPLTSVAGKKAVFSSLSYEITAPNTLEVRLRMRDDDGETFTEVFEFTRAEL